MYESPEYQNIKHLILLIPGNPPSDRAESFEVENLSKEERLFHILQSAKKSLTYKQVLALSNLNESEIFENKTLLNLLDFYRSLEIDKDGFYMYQSCFGHETKIGKTIIEDGALTEELDFVIVFPEI